jgi:hypothetical protein
MTAGSRSFRVEARCELRLSEFDDVGSPATSSIFLNSLEGVTFVNAPPPWFRRNQWRVILRVILTVPLRPFDRAAAALCMQSRGPDLQ